MDLDKIAGLERDMMKMAQDRDVEPEEYVAACVLVLVSFREVDPERCDALVLAMTSILRDAEKKRKEKAN